MNKLYLSEQKIKSLKKYLNEKLPNKTRATIIQIKLKTGLELYNYECNTKNNKQLFWVYCHNKLFNSNDPLASEFKIKLKTFSSQEAGIILQQYIEQNYKKEWQTVNSFDMSAIHNFLFGITGFFKYSNIIINDNNYYTYINIIKELVECQNIDDFIDEKFSKKYIDKDLLEKTDDMIKEIKIFYKDVELNSKEYYKIRNATDAFLKNKDESELHNMLNS